MATFQAQPTQNAFAVPGTQTEDQVEVIWQMGCVSFSSNNNELRLPPDMATQLSDDSIKELKVRLRCDDHCIIRIFANSSSLYLGCVPVFAFLDQDKQVFRICQAPQLLMTGDNPGSNPSSGPIAETTKRRTPESDPLEVYKPGVLAKKVPRPPNAFILYRKEHQPLLKQQNPSLHNNEISKILGKQWNSEHESVKSRYKRMAERIKHKHAADNPGYQYAPRKPSEKKRRMMARKMAQLQNTMLKQTSPIQAGIGMLDIADYECDDSEGVPMLDAERGEDGFIFLNGSPLTAEDVLGTRRPAAMSHLTPSQENRLVITLPTGGNQQLQQEADDYSQQDGKSSARNPNPHGNSITTTQASHVTNDQDFFESLVNWEAIAADVALVKSVTQEELEELADVELGNPYLLLSEEGHRTSFEKELDRTLRLFKG
jgi:HMG (high mobility group) box